MTAHDGGCACGAIRFRMTGEPLVSVACACRDCQRSTGGPEAHAVAVNKDQLEMLRGRTRSYWSFADSGVRVGRHFCEVCGSPIFAENASHRDMVAIKVGAFDDPAPFAPQVVIWTASAQPWMRFDPEVTAFERNPPGNAEAEEAAS